MPIPFPPPCKALGTRFAKGRACIASPHGGIMMTRILVAFAMQEELAPWKRRHRFRPAANSPHPVSVASFGSTEVYVALAGAGAPHAHHFDDLTMHLTPSLGIVTGVAAGLKREWRPGDLLVARSVSDPEGSAGIPASPHLVAMAEQCGARPGTHPAYPAAHCPHPGGKDAPGSAGRCGGYGKPSVDQAMVRSRNTLARPARHSGPGGNAYEVRF